MMNRNKKKFIRNLIVWLVAIAALAALIIFVFIPIYSEREVSSGREPHLIFYEGDGAPVLIENDKLSLELDGATTQFKVTDKANGKVW